MIEENLIEKKKRFERIEAQKKEEAILIDKEMKAKLALEEKRIQEI